jgi:hypothetical protein
MMPPYEIGPRKTLTLYLAQKAARRQCIADGIAGGSVVEVGETLATEYTGSSPYEKMERVLTASPAFGYN